MTRRKGALEGATYQCIHNQPAHGLSSFCLVGLVKEGQGLPCQAFYCPTKAAANNHKDGDILMDFSREDSITFGLSRPPLTTAQKFPFYTHC